MPVDDVLVERIRELVAADGRAGWSEGRMFGGVAFLLEGYMTICASTHGGILVRVDREATERLVGTTAATPMVMRGRELDGWVRVGADDVRTTRQLSTWFRRGVAVVEALPPKPKAKAKAKGQSPRSPKGTGPATTTRR